MKALKVILAIILILALIVVVMGMLAPKSVSMERTSVVDAPRAQVYSYLADYGNFGEWNPWSAMDSTQEVTITGEPGTEGYKYAWNGEVTGQGEMVVSEVKDGEYIGQAMRFIAPFQSDAKTYYSLKDTEDGKTEVAWGYEENDMPFMNRMFMMLGGKSSLEKQFDTGLSNLSEKAEKIKMMSGSGAGSFDVYESDEPDKLYLGVRDVVNISEMQQFFGDSYGKVMEAMDKMEIEAAGPPVGIYYSWNPEEGNTDLAAAIPVTDKGGLIGRLIEGVKKIEIPASKGIVVDHMGAYEELGGAHEAMDVYMTENDMEFNEVCIEEYITDPMSEPDTAKWHTRLVYRVK